MTPARVVPGFDPLEDRAREFVFGGPLLVSRSSRCIVDENDSIVVLSTLEATLPIEPSSPARLRSLLRTIAIGRCFGEVLPELAVGALVGAALPGTLRISGVDGDT